MAPTHRFKSLLSPPATARAAQTATAVPANREAAPTASPGRSGARSDDPSLAAPHDKPTPSNGTPSPKRAPRLSKPTKNPAAAIANQGARRAIGVGPVSSRSNAATARPPKAIAAPAIVQMSPSI